MKRYKILNKLMDLAKQIPRHNVESISWMLPVVYDKVLPKRDKLRKKLFRIQARFRRNIEG